MRCARWPAPPLQAEDGLVEATDSWSGGDRRRVEDAAYGLRWLELTHAGSFDLSRSLASQLPLARLDG